ncbi:MAG: CBS domain-containing protein [Candidatus Competibacteraceae bacterium]|nr:CBS domain-containing protein [Candidatus Competibacteraceae bacterium]
MAISDDLDRKTFLAQLPPFNQLPESELERLAQELTVGRYAAGEALIKAGEMPAGLFIVIDGAVWETDDALSAPDSAKTFGPGSATLLCITSFYASEDTFDTRALLEGASKRSFVAAEATRCYCLPRTAFLQAVRDNPGFARFYDLTISQRPAPRQTADDVRELSAFTVTKIQDVYIHPPTYVTAEATIREAAVAMKANKTNSVLVRHGDQTGIVTATDLREAAIIERRSLDAPVGPLATYELVGMTPDDFLFNALLRMTRHNISRLVIRDGPAIHGILEQIDLLSYWSNHSHLIALQIERAHSKEELKWASRDLINVIRDLYAKGIKIRYIMQLVSELNKKMLRKLFELLVPPALLDNACLLVLGSEGREEQVLKTDQDNALILRDEFSWPELERITQEFTESLLDFGYPRCPGNIMVSNPTGPSRWRASRKNCFSGSSIPLTIPSCNSRSFSTPRRWPAMKTCCGTSRIGCTACSATIGPFTANSPGPPWRLKHRSVFSPISCLRKIAMNWILRKAASFPSFTASAAWPWSTAYRKPIPSNASPP